MKKISVLISFILVLAMLSGCTGTPVVYYSDCTCPTEAVQNPVQVTTPVAVEGAVKTGLAILTDLSDSSSALPVPEDTTAAEELELNGCAQYDVTVVAVNVDDNGVITACVIDSIPASAQFDASGAIASDLAAEILTKNEQGESYGMKAYAGSKYEWNEQVAALSNYAVGKNVSELRGIAINESGKAADADLAATATIYLGSYISGIEAAAANARHLGAQAGDTLKLASISSLEGAGATDEATGYIQLNADVTALTMKDAVITSCYIDALQARVEFDASGNVTTDLSAPVLTKNELGEDYGMKAYAGAKFEWNEQAANFAAYVTGLTAEEVLNIAVSESAKPADGTDLAATVTISVMGFQKLIDKAAQ